MSWNKRTKIEKDIICKNFLKVFEFHPAEIGTVFRQESNPRLRWRCSVRSFVVSHIYLFGQGGRGTKVHVYLPYRGAISFYVYIVPSGLVSIFLDVECDKISCCGLQPTRFFPEFSIKLYY